MLPRLNSREQSEPASVTFLSAASLNVHFRPKVDMGHGSPQADLGDIG
jgi:hypothetical protein